MYKYVLIVVALFLIGCSPKYVTKNQYVASKEQGFGTCVKRCEVQKQECQLKSKEEYKVCLDDAYNRAKDISAEQFVKYDIDYEEFLLEFRDFKYYKYEFDKNYSILERDYNYFSKECNSKKDEFTCRRKNELKDTLEMMKRDKLKKPREPKKPSFNRILKSQQNLCKIDNSCSTNFDMCYIKCGGEVIPYRFCVKNCD